MRRYRLLGLASLLLTLAPSSTAQEIWMRVQLDGRKVGSLMIERAQGGDTVTTRQSLDIELDRVGTPLRIHSRIASVETTAGEVREFSATTRLSQAVTEVHGWRQDDGRFRVSATTGGRTRTFSMPWPRDALLLEGQRLALRAHRLETGTTFRVRSFNPASQRVVPLDMQILGPSMVELPEGPQRLTRIRQTLHHEQHAQVMDLWVNADGEVIKGRLPLLGFTMEMIACTHACATAPNQHVDLLRETMVESPRPIPASDRAGQMRYVFRLDDGAQGRFIATGEQQVQALGNGFWRVDVGRARPNGADLPRPSDTAATDWLQADAPLIRMLARSARGGGRSAGERMRNMTRFVHEYVDDHGLDVGYGSALETARSRQGDCTEHAVLLAALARAEGIPARVVSGLVYADRYGGRQHVFIPHAWVQAWVDRRWRSFDPTLGHFDSAHVALAVGDGDPWRYFDGLSVLGRITLIRATPTGQLMELLPGPGGDSGGATR